MVSRRKDKIFQPNLELVYFNRFRRISGEKSPFGEIKVREAYGVVIPIWSSPQLNRTVLEP